MGALANAVLLMDDPIFAKWCTTAGAYQARLILAEADNAPDHAIRLRLAHDVLAGPNIITANLVMLVGTDPEVAAKGSTPVAVTEDLVLAKVASVWTTLAKLRFPNG